jgi:asparagine synthase (glutamine-hydrolysing)
MGNGGVSWNGGSSRIFYLLVHGRWDAARRALRVYKQQQGCSWFTAVRRHLVSPLLGPRLRDRRRRLHPKQPPWRQNSSIHPEFARRMGLWQAMLAEGHDFFFSLPRVPEWERRRVIEMNAPGGYIYHLFSDAFRMEVRDPTADVQFLTFCFGVPDELHNLDGGERTLLRRSLARVLPREVCWNSIRGRQAADVALRLLDYREGMEAELTALESHGAVAAYLEVGALRYAWQNLQAAVLPRTSLMAAALLLRGVMAGRFIAGLIDGRETGSG